MSNFVPPPPNRPAPNPDKGPPWYLVAHQEQGTREVAGTGINPRIQAYYTATDIGRVNDDAVPWCSAFANWCMKQAGFKGTNKANARSWLYWGVPIIQPRLGCVVVFSRPPNEASGHVAFYCGEVARKNGPNDLLVLGGNQGNMVCATAYAKARVLSYRWPGPKETPAPAPVGNAAPPPLKPAKKK